jgi:hypothetical protein
LDSRKRRRAWLHRGPVSLTFTGDKMKYVIILAGLIACGDKSEDETGIDPVEEVETPVEETEGEESEESSEESEESEGETEETETEETEGEE